MATYQPVQGTLSLDNTPSSTWRPWPLRQWFLISFPVLCALLCITIEVIIQGCHGGCHVFGPYSAADHSWMTSFAYSQMPTILSLALNLLWGLPHHNVMRLEPYFRMSTPGGTTAEDSIFLQYPYIFPVYVPYKAMKRRHYVVLLSSCIALLMTFVQTPLISGMFIDRYFVVSVQGDAAMAVLNRESGFERPTSEDFSYVAYNYMWHGGKLPAFTTPEYTVLPVLEMAGMGVGNETWVAETKLYEAELNCDNAKVDITWHADVRGASIEIQSTAKRDLTVQLCDQRFAGRRNGTNKQHCDAYSPLMSPWTSVFYALPVGGNSQQTYMYAWVSGPGSTSVNTSAANPPTNATALFCTANYYSETIIANFTMPEGQINSVNRTGIRTPFTFLNLTGTIFGELDIFGDLHSNPLVPFGTQPAQVPNIDTELRRRLGERPADLGKYFTDLNLKDPGLNSKSIVYIHRPQALHGYALFNRTKQNIAEFLDPSILAASYDSVLKLWFALAIAVDMLDNSPGALAPSTVAVTRNIWTRGFVVDLPWARGAQSILAVVTVISAVLAVWIGKRPCNLDGEPNSLAEALRLLAASPEVCAIMQDAEFYPPNAIRMLFNGVGGRWELKLVPGQGPRLQPIVVQDQLISPAASAGEPWMEKPYQFGAIFGVGCPLAIAVVLAIVAAAFGYSRAWGGLPAFAPIQSVEYKILFTYLPVALGMATEPILVAVGTCRYMLAPYANLTPGPAPSSKSLALDYDKSPPHFQLYSSLRTRNFALAALTAAILLSNVLAVALVGLFSATSGKIASNIDIPIFAMPTFEGEFTVPAVEMYYILDGVLSGNSSGLTAPTWTTTEYYVLPLLLTDAPAGLEAYQVSTLGIGVDIRCGPVRANHVRQSCDPTSKYKNCLSPGRDFSWINLVTVDDLCWPDSPTARVKRWRGPARDFLVPSIKCRDTIFPMWLEQPGNPNPKLNPLRHKLDIYEDFLAGLVLNCAITDKLVMLNADVTRDGQVLSTTSVRQLDSQEVAEFYPANPTTSLASRFFDKIVTGSWADTIDEKTNIQWFNHLIATVEPKTIRNLTNNTRIPDAAYIAAAFEDIYRRLFAIHLRLQADEVIFAPAQQQMPKTAPGQAILRMDRVTVDTTMFSLAASILAIMIVVLVVLYWDQRQPIGNLPNTLAGMYALLYASNAKEECGKIYGRNPKQRARRLEERKGMYVYGMFSSGGSKHYGVYREGDLPEEED